MNREYNHRKNFKPQYNKFWIKTISQNCLQDYLYLNIDNIDEDTDELDKELYFIDNEREYKSNVYDIENGDNFEDYAKEFYDYYKECFEDLYEDN